MKLASCKSALNPPVVYSTDRSKVVVPVLVFLFVALWFILRGDLLYVFPCVILFLCFSVLLVLRLPRLEKRELIFPDTQRKRKPTNPNKHKSNKRTKSTKISSLFPKRGNRNAKRTEKKPHKNKMTQGKT